MREILDEGIKIPQKRRFPRRYFIAPVLVAVIFFLVILIPFTREIALLKFMFLALTIDGGVALATVYCRYAKLPVIGWAERLTLLLMAAIALILNYGIEAWSHTNILEVFQDLWAQLFQPPHQWLARIKLLVTFTATGIFAGTLIPLKPPPILYWLGFTSKPE